MTAAPHDRAPHDRPRRSGARRRCTVDVVDLRRHLAGDRIRTLHVVDVENVLGGTHETADVHQVAEALSAYDAAVGARPDDLTFYGANPALQFRVHEATARGRVVGRRGPDGADDALLDMVAGDWVVERFDRVCIGSGDHAFAPFAAALRTAGVHVVVACAPGRISAELYRAASEHVALAPVLVGAPA